ncbi:MAG: DUF4157 domain-containing protein [Oscillospiraceae bacterium]|nr:DUF4157 domain-containing protein [Oscillospiraceae bacterium]
MSKVYLDLAAEKEADDIGRKFMNSTDVVGDMSRAYGKDLSSVKLHTDEGAADKAASRGVDAFSTGKDVFFARGVFDKSDPMSRGILAHELAHSLQQGVGSDMGGMSESVQQSAPEGAPQGLFGWFRNRRARKRQAQEQAVPAPAPVPQSLYAEAFGDEGYDATEGMQGYVLPESLRKQTTGAQKTRFSSKEARDMYAAVKNNPQLMKHQGVRDAMFAHYQAEMPGVFQKYTREDGSKNFDEFSMKVMRSEEAGGMRLLSALMGYHATKNGDSSIANTTKQGFSFEALTPEKEAAIMAREDLDLAQKNAMINEGRSAAKKIDVSAQFENLAGATENDEELMSLIEKHSDTLRDSGFYDQEKADTQAMSDFLLRGVNPEFATDDYYRPLSIGMQRQAALPENARSEKSNAFFRLLKGRRAKRG